MAANSDENGAKLRGWNLVCKGGNASNAAANDQGVNVVGAFVGIHSLQVHYVPGNKFNFNHQILNYIKIIMNA